MMNSEKIWKYELEITDRQMIPIPNGRAKPLAVAEQNGKLVMWVKVDEEYVDDKEYAFCVDIVGTGNTLDTIGNYIGTVVMSYGLVWHIFVDYTLR
jgi:hypothetical protein